MNAQTVPDTRGLVPAIHDLLRGVKKTWREREAVQLDRNSVRRMKHFK